MKWKITAPVENGTMAIPLWILRFYNKVRFPLTISDRDDWRFLIHGFKITGLCFFGYFMFHSYQTQHTSWAVALFSNANIKMFLAMFLLGTQEGGISSLHRAFRKITSTINQQMHLYNVHLNTLKHLKPLRHVSIFSDHHQGISSFLAKVITYSRFSSFL